jgi:hypothetical protein
MNKKVFIGVGLEVVVSGGGQTGPDHFLRVSFQFTPAKNKVCQLKSTKLRQSNVTICHVLATSHQDV